MKISLCSLAKEILTSRSFTKKKKKREAGSIDAVILYADEQQIKLFVSIYVCFILHPIFPLESYVQLVANYLRICIVLRHIFITRHIVENNID